MVKLFIEKTSVILFNEIFLIVSKLYKITSVFSLFLHKIHDFVDNTSEDFQKIPKLKNNANLIEKTVYYWYNLCIIINL